MMVVVFGTFDIDIDLDTIYEYGNALARILMATSPILLIGYILLTANEGEEIEKGKLAFSKTCIDVHEPRVMEKKGRMNIKNDIKNSRDRSRGKY